jgi:hypothetical protein
MNLPKAIAALPKWADEYPSHYQLDCIRLRADGRQAYAEATDGCRLCRLTWHCEGVEGDYRLPHKALARALRSVGVTPDGYHASLNGDVTVYGKKSGATVKPEEPERWPQSEEVLYPEPGTEPILLSAKELRDRARAALKAGEDGMTLKIDDVTTKLTSKYVRDMAETAIQCGYDNVAASTKDEKSAVHFWADGKLLFDSVIMPRLD